MTDLATPATPSGHVRQSRKFEAKAFGAELLQVGLLPPRQEKGAIPVGLRTVDHRHGQLLAKLSLGRTVGRDCSHEVIDVRRELRFPGNSAATVDSGCLDFTFPFVSQSNDDALLPVWNACPVTPEGRGAHSEAAYRDNQCPPSNFHEPQRIGVRYA